MATHYWRGDGGNTLKLLLNSRDLPRQHVDAFTARVRFSVLSDANMQELAASSFFHQRWCVVIIVMHADGGMQSVRNPDSRLTCVGMR